MMRFLLVFLFCIHLQVGSSLARPYVPSEKVETDKPVDVVVSTDESKQERRSNPSGNLIKDGGFEVPNHQGAAYVPHGVGPLGAWTIESGTVDIVGPYWRASEGKQSLDLSGLQENPGTIFQEIETNPSQYYRVRFVASANPEPADRLNIKRLRVFWADKALKTIKLNPKRHDFHNVGWKIYEFKVRGTEGLTRLKFQSLTNTPCGPILDDISVTLLPKREWPSSKKQRTNAEKNR